jgi:hypothetical protein
LAQELVADIDSVVQIVNRIEAVSSRHPTPSHGKAGAVPPIEAIPSGLGLPAHDSPVKSITPIPNAIGEEDHDDS